MSWIIAVIIAFLLLECSLFLCLGLCFKRIPKPFDFESRCKSQYLGNNVNELSQNQEYIIDVCRDDVVDTMIQCRVWIKDNKNKYSDILLFYDDYSKFKDDWIFEFTYVELRKWGST